MTPRSVARVTTSKPAVRLHNGDHMDQPTFHALYEHTPDGFKAELIGGIVYVASPTTSRHGYPHGAAVHWLYTYYAQTPGVRPFDNTTNVLTEDSEPQPDACLTVLPECGGQTTIDGDGNLVGAAELVVEVAYSSVAIDLHAKRADYEAAGVREYFVALVEPQQVVRFVRRGSRLVERPADGDGILRSAAFPGLWLDPAGLFADNIHLLDAGVREGLATPEHAAFVAKLEAKRTRRRRS